MKAGIYKTPNDNLIYVAKDRTIKATTLSPSAPWPGTKVSHRSNDDTVVIEGTDYRCTRLCGVPNGCNDAQAALRQAHQDMLEYAKSEYVNFGLPKLRPYQEQAIESFESFNRLTLATDQANVALVDYACANRDPVDEMALTLREQGYRPCHRQSARKHRRAGRRVLRIDGDDRGRYWWKKGEAA